MAALNKSQDRAGPPLSYRMDPYYEHNDVTIYHADALAALRAMPDACIDSVVTDPPYGLAFMGKRWDYDVPSVELWREVFRVLKPGGHLLSFGGTRTYHRMVVNVEDAGFEPRDMLSWVYASGFPKSHDVSKAIDKMHGAEREVVGVHPAPASTKRIQTMGRPDHSGSGWNEAVDITDPATDDAKRWAGFGSALKPAVEPILLARKPLDGTIAQNVLRHGVGGLNVDGCRIKTGEDTTTRHNSSSSYLTGMIGEVQPIQDAYVTGSTNGRWPANLLHDGSEEVLALFPVTNGSSNYSKSGFREGGNPDYTVGINGTKNAPDNYGDGTGSAARFFYTAKASKAERGPGNRHPTVKPIALMRYLCRLVTPPGGVVLDPFGGSGTTALSARLEGFSCILCERDEESAATAVRRLECEVIETDGNYELREKREEQLSLFKAA